MNYKPGSVEVDHLSSPDVTIGIKRLTVVEAGYLVDYPLQQAGFTSLKRHRSRLWAFTLELTP